MKKKIARLVLAVILLMNIVGFALAQKPKADKDTVNADKAAKPAFYQAAEEETSKGDNTALYIAFGVLAGAGVVFMLRKKKK